VLVSRERNQGYSDNDKSIVRTSPELQQKYLPTRDRSSLGRIVDEFDIPATLKLYLSDFAELPLVRKREPAQLPVIRCTESWD